MNAPKISNLQSPISQAAPKRPDRLEDWPSILADYLEYRSPMAFVYGSHDCCLFAADWVYECTGTDIAAEYRGKYQTEAAALKLLAKHRGVRGLIETQLYRVPLAFAQRGDLAAFRDPDIPGPPWASTALGILDGRHALFAGKEGLRAIPRSALMKTAWRVGATRRAPPISNLNSQMPGNAGPWRAR